MNIPDELRKLTKQISFLLEEQEMIFASPDDAAFFRKENKTKKSPPKIEPAPLPIIRPNPLPAPVIPLPGCQAAHVQEQKRCSQVLNAAADDALRTDFSITSDITVPLQPSHISPVKEKSTQAPHSFLRALLKKTAPHLVLIDQPPDDTKAKNLKEAWKTMGQAAPISTLIFGEPPEHQLLLKELTLALNVCFDPAKTIDAEQLEIKNQWGSFLESTNLKWIIMCDATLWQLPSLRTFYREIPSQETRYLKNIPLFLLPNLSLYLTNPSLKKSLWEKICTYFSETLKYTQINSKIGQ